MTLARKLALKALLRARIERYNISALPVVGLAEKMNKNGKLVESLEVKNEDIDVWS